jgi:hypothetical protein
MASVIIDIAAEFTGNKAFKQAESSTDKLIKGVKRLAGATGLAFGTAQVIAFGKASVKASLEAQAQQERLASLLKVTVGARDSEIQALNDQAEALQNIGVVSKDNITQVQSQLATFNLQIDTIKSLTPAILDYVTAEKGATASADQFKQMTNGLAQALNGNFASLTKTGFVLDEATKKTIKNGSESDRTAAIIKVLDSTYKDFNKNLGETDSGQMAKLSNAANDVQEIIGKGIIDSLKTLGKDNSVETLVKNMNDLAFYIADVIRGIGVLIKKIGDIPILGDALSFLFTSSPLLDYLADLGKVTAIQKSSDNQHLKALENQYKVIRKTGNLTTKLTADELKKLKAKQLQLAIDKANLALGKSEGVFDIDKIQIAASLVNQAELLGKATDAAQVLQIANDTARLNVKRSMLALEEAIASKDEAAIIAATNKLNLDLKALSALTGQSVKLTDIKSILDTLKPVDLINQSNLDLALAKIREMLTLLASATGQSKTKVPNSGSLGSGIPVGDYVAPVSMTDALAASTDSLIEYADAAAARANAFADLLDLQNAADLAAFLSSSLNVAAAPSGSLQSFRQSESATINIYANTIANPDELTNMIQDSLIRLNKRGDYITTAGSL